MKKQKKWYKLDNAALIYPSVRNKRWMAMFRLCAELTEAVDPSVLETALRNTLKRLTTFGTCIKRGLFWFYLEELEGIPPIEEDVANPCLPIDVKRNGGFLFRVRYHNTRIALEFFHVLADGTGGLCFLKTLVGEYIRLKYGVNPEYTDSVLDTGEAPRAEETEDSFVRYAQKISVARSEESAYKIPGAGEIYGFMNIVTGIADTDALLRVAHGYGVTVTQYITACMINSIAEIQKNEKPRPGRDRPVKICVPVNLRAFFPSVTIRNFSSYVNPGINNRYGEHTFEETLTAVRHFMGLEVTRQKLLAKFSSNVVSQKNPVIKWTPLFLKIPIMRLVYRATGDIQTSSLMSNLGQTELPEEMKKYVTRMDFQIGPLKENRVMCAVISYGGRTAVNFTRTMRSAEVEKGVFRRFVEDGIPVVAESNLEAKKMLLKKDERQERQM